MMMRRCVSAGLLAAGVFAFSPAVSPVWACPSCKEANATESPLPRAYQASIIFMLTVPALLVTGFGVSLYRLNKIQETATREFESGDVWTGDPSESG